MTHPTPPLPGSPAIVERRASPKGKAAPHGAVRDVVAAALGVSLKDLRASTRGRADVALARKCGMYLARVALGMTLADAGRMFGRDRSTAAHACRMIEDARDDPAIDAYLSIMEELVQRRSVNRSEPDDR